MVRSLWAVGCSCQPTFPSAVDLPHPETTVSQDDNVLSKEKTEPSRKELPHSFTHIQRHCSGVPLLQILTCFWPGSSVPREPRPSTCRSWDSLSHALWFSYVTETRPLLYRHVIGLTVKNGNLAEVVSKGTILSRVPVLRQGGNCDRPSLERTTQGAALVLGRLLVFVCGARDPRMHEGRMPDRHSTTEQLLLQM